MSASGRGSGLKAGYIGVMLRYNTRICRGHKGLYYIVYIQVYKGIMEGVI